MKKLSKRKRMQRRQREQARTAMQREKGYQGVAVKPPETGGMRIKCIHQYIPARIEEPLVASAAGGNEHQLVFKPHAVQRLKQAIAWGSQTHENVTEQQGILLGQVYESPSGYLGVVEEILLSGAVGTEVYVESSHSQWFEMERQMDALNESRSRKLVKVGWWHTHPNMSVFMSGTDRATQAGYFYEDWQFAAVLNPQGQKWAAFIGADATPCAGYFLNYNPFKSKGRREAV